MEAQKWSQVNTKRCIVATTQTHTHAHHELSKISTQTKLGDVVSQKTYQLGKSFGIIAFAKDMVEIK